MTTHKRREKREAQHPNASFHTKFPLPNLFVFIICLRRGAGNFKVDLKLFISGRYLACFAPRPPHACARRDGKCRCPACLPDITVSVMLCFCSLFLMITSGILFFLNFSSEDDTAFVCIFQIFQKVQREGSFGNFFPSVFACCNQLALHFPPS